MPLQWFFGPYSTPSRKRTGPEIGSAAGIPISLRNRGVWIHLPLCFQHWVCEVYNSENVYPTKQPTGTELYQLVHAAAVHFPRVGLYFETSLLAADIELLQSAAAAVSRIDRAGAKMSIESGAGVGLPWKGAVQVDGRFWPAADDRTVWLPPGVHTLEAAAPQKGPRLLRFNGELQTARLLGAEALEFSYRSSARSIAILDRAPVSTKVDGVAENVLKAGPTALMLPAGEHLITVFTE